MGVMDFIDRINPFSSTFEQNRKTDDYILDQIDRNSLGSGDIETFSFEQTEKQKNQNPIDNGEFSYTYATFDNYVSNKISKIKLYREMSRYPEISQAITMFCNQAVVEDAQHRICSLDYTNEIKIDKKTQLKLKEEFEYYVTSILKLKDTGYKLFKRFLIESELYPEYIVNDKSNGLIGFKVLPAHTMTVHYKPNGNVSHYTQELQGRPTQRFESNQIGYISWEEYGDSIWDVRGYLEDAVRTYNQLRALEDAIVVTRLVRAPERRIWNISVGRMTNAKAEEYLRKVISKYKKSVVYDENTGKIDLGKNIQSLTEDYWFARREGDSTSVETLQSGANLGELTDVEYFKNKLYNALKLPVSRFTPGSGGVYQNGMDLEREELDFQLYVQRAQNKFKKFILDGFIEHIRLKYKNDNSILKYIYKRELFDVYFVPSSYFKQIREIETNTRKLTMLNDFVGLIRPDAETGAVQPFDMEFFLREMCNFQDDIIVKMNQYWKKNKPKDGSEIPPVEPTPTDSMGGDTGMGTDQATADLGGDTTGELGTDTGEQIPIEEPTATEPTTEEPTTPSV